MRGGDLLLAFGRNHDHLARAGESAASGVAGDLVFLEQPVNAPGKRFDHALLAVHHGVEVERHLFDLDAVNREAIARFGVKLARLQKRLAWDATDSQASAPQRRLLLNAGNVHPQLRRTDGRHVSARTSADNDEVVLHARSKVRGRGEISHAEARSLDRITGSARFTGRDLLRLTAIGPRLVTRGRRRRSSSSVSRKSGYPVLLVISQLKSERVLRSLP